MRRRISPDLRGTRSAFWLALLTATLTVAMTGISAAARGPAAVVRDGRADRPQIALTIDDGYDTGVCHQMLDTLRSRKVPATWFPIGKNVAAHAHFWRDVARDYPIANHTQFHAILPALGARKIRRQIRLAEWTVQRVTGKPILKVFRPPGGALDARVRWIAGSLGYPVLLIWDTTNLDTDLRASQGERLSAALRGTNGSVILMHCNHQWSADLLPRIIRSYRQRGYRFVTVGHLLKRAGFVTATEATSG